ncbi:hydrogen gas-evolving membrane-bound hydrogenase subunit E [Thauera sinica]|uniref:Hydrogen gas-evolving membrane-bound hydrogenase subunit E n=1 Tax=Thauera sinica TaxID=2665146 RepID=A0ABW1AT24_9RHOO|nr:hydrogen gas-evolving membrane-bound hydrogenase subunit E [Thauera sp. K11]ATE58825.1 cation:proton antiporter [Thauera sp. K11]
MNLSLIVILPFLGAPLAALLIRAGRNACAGAAFAASLAAFLLLLSHLPGVLQGEVLQAGWEWLPGLGLDAEFRLDGLGFLFALLILGIGLPVIAYARFHLAERDPTGSFMARLLSLQGAMLGIVLADNVLLLLVFWWLAGLSSFLLIGYRRHLPEGRQGARMALVVIGAGGLAMIAGMLILGDVAGSYRLSDIFEQAEAIRAAPQYLPALLLILAGCFTASAQLPFHFWLPHAMAAPTPALAYLHSATMAKAGVFLLARMWPVLAGTDAWFYLVATTGLATMLAGAFIALFKDDLKAVLAYSTIGHLGLVTMLLGFGTPMAMVAGVFHILSHAVAKAALFMSAGIVGREAGTRDIPRLGGLAQAMPLTAAPALLAGAAMAGVPPLSGFVSNGMMLHEATLAEWGGNGWLVAVLATLAACLAAACSLRLVVHVFFGRARAVLPQAPHDPPAGMWLPPAILAVLAAGLGVLPAPLAGALVDAAASAATGAPLPEYELALWHGLTPAIGLSALALLAGLVLLKAYRSARASWAAGLHPQAKAMFDAVLAYFVDLARTITQGVHDGSLQRQLAFAVGAVLVLGFATFLTTPYAPGARVPLAAGPVAVAGWLVLVFACIAVLALHRRRLPALAMAGVAGLVVALGFAHLSAPGLALAQIAAGVVTMILLLLALAHLPRETPRERGLPRRLRDAVLAAAAGLGAAGAAWAMMTRDFETLSGYYLEQSVPGGGGRNVVNVIAMDFRAFDTFGGIAALGTAALAVFALLDGASSDAAGGRAVPVAPTYPPTLAAAMRAMLILALAIGAFVFLRGRDAPGGGLVAGLAVAAALILQHMAHGMDGAGARLHIDYHTPLGWGVLAAALTGLGAWFAGYPFLTSAVWHADIPLLGAVRVASTLFFDTGVFLVVAGATLLTLTSLARIRGQDGAAGALPQGTLR